MIEGALKLFVAFSRELAKVASEHTGLPLEEIRKFVFELGVQVGRTTEHPAVEQANAELDVALMEFGAFSDGADGMA